MINITTSFSASPPPDPHHLQVSLCTLLVFYANIPPPYPSSLLYPASTNTSTQHLTLLVHSHSSRSPSASPSLAYSVITITLIPYHFTTPTLLHASNMHTIPHTVITPTLPLPHLRITVTSTTSTLPAFYDYPGVSRLFLSPTSSNTSDPCRRLSLNCVT